jgi:hypothetical protein
VGQQYSTGGGLSRNGQSSLSCVLRACREVGVRLNGFPLAADDRPKRAELNLPRLRVLLRRRSTNPPESKNSLTAADLGPRALLRNSRIENSPAQNFAVSPRPLSLASPLPKPFNPTPAALCFCVGRVAAYLSHFFACSSVPDFVSAREERKSPNARATLVA